MSVSMSSVCGGTQIIQLGGTLEGHPKNITRDLKVDHDAIER